MNPFQKIPKLMIGLMLLFSTSCRTQDAIRTVTITEIQYAIPSDSLLLTCPVIDDFKMSTNGEMLMSLLDLSANYSICSARMNAIVEYFNILKLNNDVVTKDP